MASASPRTRQTHKATERKTEQSAPMPWAMNWLTGLAPTRWPVFRSPVMSVVCAAVPAEWRPASRLTRSAWLLWPLTGLMSSAYLPCVTPPRTSCEAFAQVETGFWTISESASRRIDAQCPSGRPT